MKQLKDGNGSPHLEGNGTNNGNGPNKHGMEDNMEQRIDWKRRNG